MFRKLTTKEKLKNERIKNAKLATKQVELENAILELAKITSEVKNG